MHKSMPPLCKGISETLKIQVEDAEFLAKSNLCSSEAELGDREAVEGMFGSQSNVFRVNPLSHLR